MNKILEWIKSHWHGKFFKFSIYFGIFDIYLTIFHNAIYHQFLDFIFLQALEPLIINIVTNTKLSDAISMALAGLIPIAIKLITLYLKKKNGIETDKS